MTEPVAAENGAQIDTDAPEPTPEGNDTGEQNGNREAAKYRTRLREAEAERDALVSRLAALQRAEIERLASAGLSHPSDIFTMSGNELADYITDTGTVDAERVAADVAAILLERPGLKPNAPAVDYSQGSGNVPHAVKAEPSWALLLKD